MSRFNRQDVAEHFAAERIVPTNEAEVEPLEGEITAYWTKAGWEGHCNNCRSVDESVAKFELRDFTIRFCPDCLDSLKTIAEALLDEERGDEYARS